MKKKSIMVRLGVVAMALTMITTSLSSGTLAKYTETVSGSTTLKIAKWDYGAKVGNSYLASSSTDLGTLLEASKSTKYDGVEDGYVAPGMHGSFNIDLTGAKEGLGSDVAADYTIYIDAEDYNLPANLKFAAGGVGVNLGADPEDTTPENYVSGKGFRIKAGTLSANTTGTQASVIVTWDWDYTQSGNLVGGDADDLQAGQITTGRQEIDLQDTIYITVEMTQKSPESKSGTVNGK